MKYVKHYITEGKLKHQYQPTGISCGNTVLKILMDYYGIFDELSIDDLVVICGTDTKTGTTDKKLMVGLDHVGIPYKQSEDKDADEAMHTLNRRINRKFFMMRTLTQGVFHWILITGKTGDLWNVMDPWLGEITYTDQEIIDIWEPRAFDGFYVPRKWKPPVSFDSFNADDYKISKIEEEDMDEVLELADEVFKDSGFDNKSYIRGSGDWDISVKLTGPDGNIIGFYVFAPSNINTDDPKYQGKGLHGIALGIDERYKAKGLGKKLIQYPYTHLKGQFDYIWGMHLKNLDNIDDWLKRREIISDIGGIYVTAGVL